MASTDVRIAHGPIFGPALMLRKTCINVHGTLCSLCIILDGIGCPLYVSNSNMAPPQEVWDHILSFISPFDLWRHDWSRKTRFTANERVAVGIQHQIFRSDQWLAAVSDHGLDFLLAGELDSLDRRERSKKPYVIATFHQREDLTETHVDELRQRIQPDLFIQSLKAPINPATLEADFGAFVLNVSGILEPGHLIEVSLGFLSLLSGKPRLVCLRYSSPDKWDKGRPKVYGGEVAFIEYTGGTLLFRKQYEFSQEGRKKHGGSWIFQNILT